MNFGFVRKTNAIKMRIQNHEIQEMNSVKKGTVVDKKKKRNTLCYSYTYHRREMKLVPFSIVKCPH